MRNIHAILRKSTADKTTKHKKECYCMTENNQWWGWTSDSSSSSTNKILLCVFSMARWWRRSFRHLYFPILHLHLNSSPSGRFFVSYTFCLFPEKTQVSKYMDLCFFWGKVVIVPGLVKIRFIFIFKFDRFWGTLQRIIEYSLFWLVRK